MATLLDLIDIEVNDEAISKRINIDINGLRNKSALTDFLSVNNGVIIKI